MGWIGGLFTRPRAFWKFWIQVPLIVLLVGARAVGGTGVEEIDALPIEEMVGALVANAILTLFGPANK